jgi:hypothetical protein
MMKIGDKRDVQTTTTKKENDNFVTMLMQKKSVNINNTKREKGEIRLRVKKKKKNEMIKCGMILKTGTKECGKPREDIKKRRLDSTNLALPNTGDLKTS